MTRVRRVVSLLSFISLMCPTSHVAADTGWSAATLFDGQWKLAVRYDVAALDSKGKFWVSAFASNGKGRMSQSSIGWVITAKFKTETGVELGVSAGINANNLFVSQKVKGNLFVAVGIRFLQ